MGATALKGVISGFTCHSDGDSGDVGAGDADGDSGDPEELQQGAISMAARGQAWGSSSAAAVESVWPHWIGADGNDINISASDLLCL